jgi:hypothetical protein
MKIDKDHDFSLGDSTIRFTKDGLWFVNGCPATAEYAAAIFSFEKIRMQNLVFAVLQP